MTSKVPNVFLDGVYKCKLSGTITADPGTGVQTLLAYSRATGLLIGTTVWDAVLHTYVLYLQEHPDQGIMLTRRDESGLYFAETYDRLSLCTEISVHGEDYMLMQSMQEPRSIILAASKSIITSYPYSILYENLKKLNGILHFEDNFREGLFKVSDLEYSLPRKVRGLVYADSNPIIYDGDSRYLISGNNNPAINKDPFGDGSLMASYPMATDGKDATGNYDAVEFDPSRFNKGGYNFLIGTAQPQTPFIIPIVITRAATRTVVFSFEQYNSAGANFELCSIPGLLYVTLFSNTIYFYSVAGTTWTTAVAWTLDVPIYSMVQVAVTISSSGLDKVSVNGQTRYTKAVGTPTVTNARYLAFNGFRNGNTTAEIVIKNIMVFNRGLNYGEIGYLWNNSYKKSAVPSVGSITSIIKTDSLITVVGSNIESNLKAEFPLINGNIGNPFGSSAGVSSVGGVSLNPLYISFNGTSGCINKSGFLAWWDVDDSATVTIVTGISKLLDKSGNGNNFIQATTTYQPSRQTAQINGRAVMRLDGTDDFLATASKFSHQSVSIFYIQKTTDTQYIVFSDSVRNAITANSADSVESSNLISYGHGALHIDGTLANTISRNGLYTALHNRVSLVSLIGLDITQWTGFRLGGYTSWYPSMDVGEIIVLPGVPTTEVIQGIEGYLAHRWGTTASLPASHPYKSVPPVGTLEEIISGTNRVNISNSDMSLTFYPVAVTAQCIWKKGNEINGVAVGIDSTAHVTLYTRNAGVLTSSSFTAPITGGSYYQFNIEGTNIVLYDSTEAVIESKAHGLTLANYQGAESIGAAYGGSPIAGTSGTSGFFSGRVTDLLFADSGTLGQKVIDSENSISFYSNNEELCTEVVKWDMENDSCVVWVKVPLLSASEDTVINITEVLPVKSGVTGSHKASKVWDSEYVGVYHMVPGDKLIDSTVNKFDGELFNIDASNFVSHLTGFALDLNGTDEYVKIKYPVLSDSQRASLSVLFRCDTIADNVRLLDLAISDSQDSSQQLNLQFDSSDQLTASLYDTAHALIGDVTSGVLGIVDDYNVTVNYDGKDTAGSLELFVDSVSADTDIPSGNRIANNAGTLHIGKDAYAGTYFDGKVSELLISKKQRSEDWNKVIDLSMKDTLGEYTLDVSETTSFVTIIPDGLISEELADFPLCINFAPVPELVYPSTFDTVTCKATSVEASFYEAYRAVDPALPVTGSWATGAWCAAPNQYTNQKFNIDYGTAKIATRMLLENAHSDGINGQIGIKDFSIYGTNSITAFNNVTYADTTDLTLLGTFIARQHISSNISDPQYFYFNNNVGYRYYVLRIANNWQMANAMLVRRISFLASDEVDVREELFAQCQDPTFLVFKQGATSLSAEIEQWDSVNKLCKFHVKVPSISDTGSTSIDATIGESINLLIGYPGSSAAANVWSNGYSAVYHMSDDPSLGGYCIIDSTTNSNNGTPTGMSSGNLVSSPFGSAISFSGSGQYITVPQNNSLEVAQVTLEAFVYVTPGYGSNNGVMVKGGLTGIQGAYSLIANTGWTFRVNGQIGEGTGQESGGTVQSQWTYLAGTQGATGQDLYVDNISVGTSEYSTAISANSQVLTIGGYYSGTYLFYGIIGEIRISNVVRSPSWLTLTYLGLKGNLNSYTIQSVSTTAFSVTIPAGSVDADLTDFPFMIDFVPVPELVYPITFDANTCKATSQYSVNYVPWYAVDPSEPLIGTSLSNSWTADVTTGNTNQKFNIDYGTPKIATRMLLEGGHSDGGSTTYSIKDFSIYGTNSITEFNNITYADITDLTLLGTFQARQHVAVNISDPQYFYFDNDVAYRYYVLRIANSWGGIIAARRISFLASDEVDVREELFAQCSDPTKLVFKQGATSLSAEIEQWDNVNNKCVFYVKVPSISSSVNTEIEITMRSEINSLIGYSGSVVAQAVWDNFIAVYQMDEDPSVAGTCVLESSNGNDIDPSGTWTSDALVNSAYGKGLQFSAGRKLTLPNFNAVTWGSFTIEATVSNLNNGGTIVNFGGGSSDWNTTNGNCILLYYHPSLNTIYLYYNSGGSATGINTNIAPVDGVAYECQIKWDGTTISLIVNGTLRGTGTGLIKPATCNQCSLGAMCYDYSQQFTGIYHYFRIANFIESDAWIKTTSDNLTRNMLISHVISSVIAEPSYNYINGFPWYNQHSFNDSVATDITGWASGNNFPINITSCKTLVTSNRVYVIGGHSATAALDVIYYAPINPDGTIGSWVLDSNSLPIPLKSHGLVQVGSLVYLIGGRTTGTDVPALTIMSATIDQSGVLGEFNIDSYDCPVGQLYCSPVVTKNRIYIFGGHTTVTLNTIYYAPINSDGTLGAWVLDSNVLPYVLFAPAGVAVISNKVYIVGGQANGTELSTVIVASFDPDTGVLGIFASTYGLPNVMEWGHCICTESFLFVFGYTNWTTSGVMYRASINGDGTINAWSTGTCYAGRRGSSGIFATSSKVYVIGGWYTSESNIVYSGDFTGGVNDYAGYSVEELAQEGTAGDLLFTIPSGTVSVDQKDIPIMLQLSVSSGISNFDVTGIFASIKEAYSKWSGNNTKYNEFGGRRNGSSDFDYPLIMQAKGSHYENNSSIRLNGSASSVIDISSNISRTMLSGTLTFSMLVFPELLHTAETVMFGVGNEFQVSYTANSGRLVVRHASTGITTSMSVIPNRWNHIIVLRDVVAKTITVYQDKLLSYGPTAYVTNPSISATAIYIGAATYTGRIAHIQIFDRILNYSEIMDLFINSEYLMYRDNIVTSIVKQDVPVFLGEDIDSIQISDSANAISTYGYNSVMAERDQQSFNTSFSGNISGWNSVAGPALLYFGSVLTSKYVYLLGGLVNNFEGSGYFTAYRAPLYADGSIGSFVYFPSLTIPSTTLGLSIVHIRNTVYILAYRGSADYGNSIIYAAQIVNGELGSFSAHPIQLTFGKHSCCTVVLNGYLHVIGGQYGGSYYRTNHVCSCKLGDDGSIDTVFFDNTVIPEISSGYKGFVTKNKIYYISETDIVYVGTQDAEGILSWTTEGSYPAGTGQPILIATTKDTVYAIGGYDGAYPLATVYRSSIDEDGNIGVWTISTSIPYSGWGYGSQGFITSSRIYVISGNTGGYGATPTIAYAPFTGGFNDYSNMGFTTVTEESSILCNYSLSKDLLTYSVLNNGWKPVASLDPAIHGYTGDNNPYYWDADSQEWVYSNSSIEEAISNAMIYPENRMDKTALGSISDFSPIYSNAIGKLHIAASLMSDGITKPEISSITVNNKNCWVSEEYVLSDFCVTVAESKVEYSFGIPNSSTDYLAGTKIYCLITGGTQWVECVNKTIPNIPVDFVTAGKSAWFKVVWDYSVWGSNALPDVSVEVKIS